MKLALISDAQCFLVSLLLNFDSVPGLLNRQRVVFAGVASIRR